jgi:hypothetical protein
VWYPDDDSQHPKNMQEWVNVTHLHVCVCGCASCWFYKLIYENLSPVSSERHQEGALECGDTTTMLSGTAKATANTTFYTVFKVFWRKIMAAAVFFSHFIPVIFHSFSMIILKHRWFIPTTTHA